MTKKMKYIITILVISLVFICVTTPVLAKYIFDKDNQLNVSSEDFYFSSDLLQEPTTAGVYPEYILSTGSDTISFRLNNFEDDLRFTEVKIDYEVCIYLENNVIYDETGVITSGSEKQSVAISVEDLEPGIYDVIVTSTTPYSKQLKGRFIIQEKDTGIQYTISDGVGSIVVMVTIATTDFSGDINIKWPEGVSPDVSNPLLANAVDCDNYTVNFKSYSEYTFVFFKNDANKVYTKDDFKITK